MEKQPKQAVYLSKKEPKMNLVALLFFMIGALPLYVQFQRESSYLKDGLRLDRNPLVKLALVGAILAAMIELLVFNLSQAL